MTYIGCTKKFKKNIENLPKTEPVSLNGFQAWHANLYWFYRRKCVLITNDSTRFSLFLTGLTKPDFLSFSDLFVARLAKELGWLDIPQGQIHKALDLLTDIRYGKTHNRSVLGTMNDMALNLEAALLSMGRLPQNEAEQHRLNHDLNRIPCQTKFNPGYYFYPAEEMKKLMARLD